MSNKKLEIICDGDSWVFGSEIVAPEIAKKYPPNTHPGAYDHLPENDYYRQPKIFPTHLAKLLNANVTNLSWPADDNGSILRRTINYISNEYIAKGKDTDNLFVMIGWSSPERNSFWFKDNDMSLSFRLWPQVAHFDHPAQEKFWELYVSYLWNAEEYIPRYVLQVMQFQNFCDANNIKWMCWNSFFQTPKKNPNEWEDLNVKQELMAIKGKNWGYQYSQTTSPNVRGTNDYNYMALWDQINPVRFYRKDLPNSTFKSHILDPNNKLKKPLVGWHPSPEGHKLWANELANYIKDNDLL